MSLESAKSFMERVKNDAAFKQRLADAADSDARAKIVEDEGYHFTREEVMQLPEELTDEQLDQVSGAGCNYCDARGAFCSMFD